MAAFGFGSEDNISLLSTQSTTELDPVEQSFRQALARMVRSVAAVAAPTVLASVPEDPLSREPSTRSRNAHIGRSDQREDRNTSRLPPQMDPLSGLRGNVSAVKDKAALVTPQMLTKLRDLKSKLKNFKGRFKSLPSRFKGARSPGEKINAPQPETEPALPVERSPGDMLHTNGTLAHLQSLPAVGDSNTFRTDRAATPQANELDDLVLSTDLDMVSLSLMPTEERVTWFENQFPAECRERVRHMGKDARETWIRKQYTAFRRHYVERAHRRRTQLSLTPSYVDSPRNSLASAPRRPERRPSSDFVLMSIGTHMDPHPFGPGDLFNENRSFTISSTTNLSQAATEVPSTRASMSSAVPSLGSNLQHHRETRSHSRPRSVASRFRHSMGRDDAARRSSIDSVARMAASRGLTGLALQTDGESVTSIRSIIPPSDSGPSRLSRRSVP